MEINWYPGHMAKAKRQLEEQIKNVDVVLELCDARLPKSSRNPDLKKLISNKKKILILGKSDLADPEETEKWLLSLRVSEPYVTSADFRKGTKSISHLMEKAAREIKERAAERGINKTIRAIVVGVPNVGKSTLINCLRGSSILKTADKPGVTKSNHWIRINPFLEVMDTPGMLWPKMNDARAAERLAYISAVKDEVIDTERLAIHLIEDLMTVSPKKTIERYRISNTQARGEELLSEVCKGRGFLLKGGSFDHERACRIILDEFRGGKLGRITLETCSINDIQTEGI